MHHSARAWSRSRRGVVARCGRAERQPELGARPSNYMDDAERLHAAISRARDGLWPELAELLFPGGERALPDALINSVPAPRRYGILHQIAHWGALDA